MRKEEREFLVRYLENMRDSYIGGEEYEIYPLTEYEALGMGIKAIRKLERIEKVIEEHDRYNMPDDVYFYEIREIFNKDKL